MVEVLFFSQLRDVFGQGEALTWSRKIDTVGAVRDLLVARGGKWTQLTATPELPVAVNQVMSDYKASIYDGDEVTFFPPATMGLVDR